MKKYNWEEIKKENGVYKTFHKECKEGEELGNFNFHSTNGEITVFDKDAEVDNTLWNYEIFVKVGG